MIDPTPDSCSVMSSRPAQIRTEWFVIAAPSLRASIHVSRFAPPRKAEELHLFIQPAEPGPVETQLPQIERAYRIAQSELGIDPSTAVFRRFFCSDPVNQAELLQRSPVACRRTGTEPCSVSWVGQPAAPLAKIALWAYHVRDPRGPIRKTQDENTLSLHRGPLTHHWTTGLTSPDPASSHDQTETIFNDYNRWLKERDMTLADHVVRTWLFVQNIDANYAGLVEARREFFARHGLTPDTHYIASSGIEGHTENVRALVSMDAYAIGGLRPEQVRFLEALDHLGPTDAYGVTFERGTAITYRHRKHVYISGTASIDPEGRILHPGDVRRQLDRTLANIEALLANADARPRDLCQLTVYLRDPSDHAVVRQALRNHFPNLPMAVVTGAVCRPGWLIEIEGLAAIPATRDDLPEY